MEKKITNAASIEIELCGEEQSIESNETEVDIINLEIKKEASCKYAFCGGTLGYTVTIKNDSDVKLEDLEFKDTLSDNTEYKAGSFKVNGAHKTPVINGKTISYEIDEIEADETIEITFEVKVVCE